MTTVRDPLERVLGAKTAKVLDAAFDMETVGDLLRHYPRRYATRGELTELSSLAEGEHVTVLAKVALVRKLPMGGRRGDRLEVIVTDGTARLTLMFFHKTGNWQPALAEQQGHEFAQSEDSGVLPRERSCARVCPTCAEHEPPP